MTKLAAKLTGKVAVVTGGSTGIGFATAKQLVQDGAKVVITARNRAALDQAVAELGPNAIALVSDTAKLEDIDRLAKKVEELGGADFLFVNAGIAKFAPVEAVDEAHYDEIQNVNTKGAFFTVQRLLPHLRSGASVVFNTSIVDEKGMPSTSAYSASKAALRSLTRTLAAELLPRGIRVNAVSPGPIETPILGKMGLPADVAQGMAAQFVEINPMKRLGRPDEVARAALFLGFDASFTTGAELPVDGGMSQL
jgi:NAD(P)-dependent dehydrogenase (short-subunit alcohol dehydrogenase family)